MKGDRLACIPLSTQSAPNLMDIGPPNVRSFEGVVGGCDVDEAEDRWNLQDRMGWGDVGSRVV